MSIKRGMDKKDVIHIYNEIYSAIKKKCHCSNMKGTRDWHTEWSQRKTVSHDITYMWNLKIKEVYKWTYLQNRSRVTDVENKHGYQGIRRGMDKLEDWDWHIYTTIYKIDN